MTWDGSKLLRHTLQFLAILSAIFTGMTRISDYKHHWSDVFIGLVMGAIAAILVVSCCLQQISSKSNVIKSLLFLRHSLWIAKFSIVI